VQGGSKGSSSQQDRRTDLGLEARLFAAFVFP
jgi:hypothetical protein